jgi:acetylornithine deacetylase
VNLLNDIQATLQRRRLEFVQVLLDVVSAPSVNPVEQEDSVERPAQQALARGLAAMGVQSELWEIRSESLLRFNEEEPAARTADWVGRPNLSASLGDRRGGRRLLLNSHVDTVGVGAAEEWSSDPFRGVVRNGRVWGRGSVDAKGSLCAMACALGTMRQLDVDLAGVVHLCSVVDEERGGGGTLAMISRGLDADAAIVGEPTDLIPCAATRSARRLRIRVHGRSAHAGEAFHGVSAIVNAYRYVEALYALGERLDQQHPHPLWSGFPRQHVFNVNGIQGGSIGRAGSVPDLCVLEAMVGGTAAVTLEDIERLTERTLDEVTESDPWLRQHPPDLEWQPQRLHASFTDPEHPFVQLCEDSVRQVVGQRLPASALSAVTDMRHLVRYADLPTITLGPGQMRVAHGADESLDIGAYLDGIGIYSLIIAEWCS